MAEIPVEVWQVVKDEEGRDILLLRDDRGRLLPIPIGVCEAASIWVRLMPELAAPYLRRPWSHDLMLAMLEQLGAKLERVVIDDYTNSTFYATLYLTHRGKEMIVDARPSDGIALTLRAAATVAVSDEVMFRAGIVPGLDDDTHNWGLDDEFPMT